MAASNFLRRLSKFIKKSQGQGRQSRFHCRSAADALQKLAPKGKKRVQKPKLTFEVLQARKKPNMLLNDITVKLIDR